MDEQRTIVTIQLPSTFTRRYRQVITRYLAKGWWRLPASERRAGFEAFNVLHAAWVQWNDESLTFRQVYDMKTSLYFLQPPRRPLVCQFYITRVDTGRGTRTLIVLMKPEAWRLIDGETVCTDLADLAEALPQSVEVQVGPMWLIVADYQLWKKKVRRKQMQEVTND